MTKREIVQQIKDIAYDIAGAELDENEPLKESGLDSLSLVAVVAAIEEKFGFAFSDDDLQPENLRMLADLVNISAKYL